MRRILGVRFLYNINYFLKEALIKLPSKLMYDNFDNGVDSCESENFYNIAKSHSDIQRLSDNDSKKILNALCYAYNKNKTSNFRTVDCDYLYFWLVHTLDEKLSDRNIVFALMETLKFILVTHGGLSICNFDKYHKYYMTQQNFEDIKLLFDYFKDYEVLQQDLQQYSWYCSIEYRALLDKYSAAYKRIMDACKTKGTGYLYCTDYEDFFNRNNRHEISDLKCTVRQNFDDIAKLEEGYGKWTLGNIDQDGYNFKDRQISEYDISYSTLAFSASKAMTIGTVVIGIIVFTIILCKVIMKFTPFAYWLKKLLLGRYKGKRNNKIDRNIIEDYPIDEYINLPRSFNLRHSKI
ncbi:variable surface protein [Plasmodium gonderi]|uniref:Variable surface protein n=1 Tax=Plasmodium gonderi TaxID=77519 RepID=A0A1Y1JXJ6_PLAGO|nr:variable surface protein [Plasmodium gonderi]GAW84524.1 variable surface protein [Plasmodium gonderi]